MNFVLSQIIPLPGTDEVLLVHVFRNADGTIRCFFDNGDKKSYENQFKEIADVLE